MTRKELAEIVAGALDARLAAKPGAVLFSGPETIAPGRFYVMGLNPGGNPARRTTSIANSLAPANGASAYTDECWNRGCDDPTCEHLKDGRLRPECRVRHQRNIVELANALGHDTPATLPSTNAIFARSTRLATLREQTGHTAQEWWAACWPVHKRLLECVHPEVIVTLGYGMNTSAFGFLAEVAGSPAVRQLGDENRRGARTFHGTLPLCASKPRVQVVGVPHPSYYAPGGRLVEELRRLAGNGESGKYV